MKDIIIKINKATRMVELPKSTIGNDGETLQSRFVFEFEDEFVNGQARLEYVVNGETKYIFLDRENETYTTSVKSFLTKKGTIDMQLVILEGTDEENVPIFKSNMFYVYCNPSINAEVEEPEEYEQWIEVANAKLNQIDNVDIDITTNNDSTMVEITRKDGTKKSAIVSGSTSGTDDYSLLKNKPKINGIELIGNKSLDDLGIKQEYTANDIKFADGDTFQDKYNSGELKGETGPQGPQGDKGEQGIQGPKGENGINGKDGKDGTNGKDGYTPVKGVDYFDGTPGKDGADGKTPVKGTDYFTAADKAEVAQEAAELVDLTGYATETFVDNAITNNENSHDLELITSFRLTEDINLLDINKDDKGEPFELETVVFELHVGEGDCAEGKSGSCYVYFKNSKGKFILQTYSAVGFSYRNPVGNGFRDGGIKTYATVRNNLGVCGGVCGTASSAIGAMMMINNYWYVNTPITSVYVGGNLPANATIYVYGARRGNDA